jgi:hypothetical protein
MSDQPETPKDPGAGPPPEPPEPEHGNVRTAGETAVDDAIGGADEPT